MADVLQHARTLASHYHAYLLTLTFTLVAASVQSAKFATNDVSNAMEILAWFTLSASGMFGLYTGAMAPREFMLRHSFELNNERAQKFAANPEWRELGLVVGKQALDDKVDEDAIRMRRERATVAQRVLFLLGFFLLLTRRAIEGLFG